MKLSAVAALTVAALANAQSRSDIPSCALPCLDNAVKQNTQCSTTDFACICQNFDSIQGSATGCVLKACGQDVALNKVLPATQALCKNAGSGGDKSSGSTSPSPSAPASQSSQPAQPSQPAETEPAEPSEPAETGSVQPSQPAAGSTQCASSAASTAAPTAPIANGTIPSAPVVTAGAAGIAPAGGLAVLALGAFLL